MGWKTTIGMAGIVGMAPIAGCDSHDTETREEPPEKPAKPAATAHDQTANTYEKACQSGDDIACRKLAANIEASKQGAGAPTKAGAEKEGPVPKAFHGNYQQGPGIAVVVQAHQIQLWMHGITRAVFMDVKSGAAEGANTYRLLETTVPTKDGMRSCKGTMTLAGGKLTFALNEDVLDCSLFNRTFEAVKR